MPDHDAPPEWFVAAFLATADSRAEQIDQAEAAWGALLEKGTVSTKWHRVRGAPLIPQSDEEYPYKVLEIRLSEPQIPVETDA